jgi:acetyltransferase-like isoleucine patch superfamily enzyme
MQNIISLLFKGFRKIYYRIKYSISEIICKFLFYVNKVDHSSFQTKGLPKIMVARGGLFSLGKDFRMNNSMVANPIGCAQPCMFFIDKDAVLVIGSNVQMSQSALVCHTKITIGDNVKLGGGVCVYDTDFHSLDPKFRKNKETDFSNKVKKSVTIGDNVFIGAHSIILKGVKIGENSIIGAASLVTKDIPSNEVWGGNPAKKIKSLT